MIDQSALMPKFLRTSLNSARSTLLRLSCIFFCGIMLFQAMVESANSAELSKEVVGEATIINVSGKIIKGDFSRFEILVRELPNPEIVVLNSSGGDLDEAMAIGKLIFQTRLTTHVWSSIDTEIIGQEDGIKSIKKGICASACTFIWLAGASRTGKNIYIHRPYHSFGDPSSIDFSTLEELRRDANRLVKDYLISIKAPNWIYDEMLAVPSYEARPLTARELRRIGRYRPDVEEWLALRCPDYFEFQRRMNDVEDKIEYARQSGALSLQHSLEDELGALAAEKISQTSCIRSAMSALRINSKP